VARIRTIKPEFFTSEDIVALEPLVRLLYIALWCEADREGRLVWKPKTFKIRYFPADEFDYENACKTLIEAKLILLYGEGLAYIPKFLDHQHINPRETPSKLPSFDASSTRRSRVGTGANLDMHAQVGRERKGTLDNASYFNDFWLAYPKKIAKANAEKAFKKANVNGDFNKVMDALEKQKHSDQWKTENGKFIPHPATWINQRRWEDEISQSEENPFLGAI